MNSKPIDAATAGSDPAGLLPSQYRSGGAASPLDRAALRLMQAVLQRAVNDYLELGSSVGDLREFASLSSWFGSRASDSPFSFEGICEALDLDGDAVRKGVARRLSEAVALDSAGGAVPQHSMELGRSGAAPVERPGRAAA